MITYFNGVHWVALETKSNIVLALASTLTELQNKLKELA